MPSTVAVDDAIRTLSGEMAKDKDTSFIGKTETEKEILAHYGAKGRRRGLLGAFAGSSVMAGLWKLSKNQKKAAGAFAMMSGALFGASYGIISIRREFFSDLLMLPPEKSPFATRARNILNTKIPENSFVRELDEKFKQSAAATDSWNEDFAASASKPKASLPPAPRRYDNDISSSIPPITGLDKPRDKKDPGDWQRDGQDAFGEPNGSEKRSPFFFGATPAATENATDFGDRNAPLAHDPFARPGSDKNTPELRHDEDDYFFGVPSEPDNQAKPTTWEEIRRRAAEQRK